MIDVPAVGTSVRVVYRNEAFARRSVYEKSWDVPETFTFTGTVAPLQKWQGDDAYNLTADTPSGFRMLRKGMTVSITDDKGRVAHGGRPQADRSVVVKGSRGDEYLVTERHGRRTCTCPGFKFHGRCKHTAALDKK
jgi:SWIM zinc finger